jgi:hypothetical protein
MLPRNKIPGKWSTKSFDHANTVKEADDDRSRQHTLFCGTQVAPNTAAVYGFQSQDAIARYPCLKLSFTLAGLFRE